MTDDHDAFWAALRRSAELVRGLPRWTSAGIRLSAQYEGFEAGPARGSREMSEGSKVIKALAQLLGASYADAKPSDECCDTWREMVANARVEYDQLRARVQELEAQLLTPSEAYEAGKGDGRSEAEARIAELEAERDAAYERGVLDGKVSTKIYAKGRAEERAAVVERIRRAAKRAAEMQHEEAGLISSWMADIAREVELGEHLTDPPPRVKRVSLEE